RRARTGVVGDGVELVRCRRECLGDRLRPAGENGEVHGLEGDDRLIINGGLVHRHTGVVASVEGADLADALGADVGNVGGWAAAVRGAAGRPPYLDLNQHGVRVHVERDLPKAAYRVLPE